MPDVAQWGNSSIAGKSTVIMQLIKLGILIALLYSTSFMVSPMMRHS